jgi:hypothetical protein
MRNLLIICLIAGLTALMGIFNQLYILSNEDCIWYIYASVTCGASAFFAIIYELSRWKQKYK